MDQDFHYYGAYYAARIGGNFNREDANYIAKASNFLDFLSNEAYGGYWSIVRDTQKQPNYNYQVVAMVDYPRYTSQGGLSVGIEGGSGGLWASYHFIPGNDSDFPESSGSAKVHGEAVDELLPAFQTRSVRSHIEAKIALLLSRPQSPLSRSLIKDTVLCFRSPERLEAILSQAAGSKDLLQEQNKADILKRFGLMLLGARAHVIADSWAHQDWSAADNEINTYWDVKDNWFGRQSIDYQDIGSDWKNVVLSSLNHENLQAVPNGTTYLGHGWMGHFPDYSFVKYRYKPCWRKKDDPAFERNNPLEFQHAFLELCSLFAQTKGNLFQPKLAEDKLNAAKAAIGAPCSIADESNCPRAHSAHQWMHEMNKVQIGAPVDVIDVKQEPDPNAVLKGQIDYKSVLESRYGTYYINCTSDLYLFAIAADYHFYFVKNWLKRHNIGPDLFTGSWSDNPGPLQNSIDHLLVVAQSR
ncbi:MAG: hypothetical protein LWX55_04145 [Deltaproteobacteria bacterium]|jgi:hypothetical protein|nr:hypothetical protein [Deltaproteobacteria bacterium]